MKRLFIALLLTLPLLAYAEEITIERINAYTEYIAGNTEAMFRFDDIETWLFAKYITLSKINLDKTAAAFAQQPFLRKTLLRGNIEEWDAIDVRTEMRQFLEGNLLEIGSLNADLSLKDKVLLELFFTKMDNALKVALQEKYAELRNSPFTYLAKNVLLPMYQANIFEKKVTRIFKALESFISGKEANLRQYVKNGVLDKKLLKGVKANDKILGAEWQFVLCSPKEGSIEKDAKAGNLCLYFKAAPYKLVFFAEMVGDNGDAHSGNAMAGSNNTIKYRTGEASSILLPTIPPNTEKGEYFILIY